MAVDEKDLRTLRERILEVLPDLHSFTVPKYSTEWWVGLSPRERILLRIDGYVRNKRNESLYRFSQMDYWGFLRQDGWGVRLLIPEDRMGDKYHAHSTAHLWANSYLSVCSVDITTDLDQHGLRTIDDLELFSVEWGSSHDFPTELFDIRYLLNDMMCQRRDSVRNGVHHRSLLEHISRTFKSRAIRRSRYLNDAASNPGCAYCLETFSDPLKLHDHWDQSPDCKTWMVHNR